MNSNYILVNEQVRSCGLTSSRDQCERGTLSECEGERGAGDREGESTYRSFTSVFGPQTDTVSSFHRLLSHTRRLCVTVRRKHRSYEPNVNIGKLRSMERNKQQTGIGRAGALRGSRSCRRLLLLRHLLLRSSSSTMDDSLSPWCLLS